MTSTWMKDLVTPDSPKPRIMWFRGMELAKSSLISPQFLSNSKVMQPKRLVKSVVRAINPVPMKVR